MKAPLEKPAEDPHYNPFLDPDIKRHFQIKYAKCRLIGHRFSPGSETKTFIYCSACNCYFPKCWITPENQ